MSSNRSSRGPRQVTGTRRRSSGGGGDRNRHSGRRNQGGGGSQNRSMAPGLLLNPWESGVVPGQRMDSRPTGGMPDIVSSISQLQRINNRESQMALNILNAVLSKNEPQYGGQKRRMDWEDPYFGRSSARGMLPTPMSPPSKLPRRNTSSSSAMSNSRRMYLARVGNKGPTRTRTRTRTRQASGRDNKAPAEKSKDKKEEEKKKKDDGDKKEKSEGGEDKEKKEGKEKKEDSLTAGGEETKGGEEGKQEEQKKKKEDLGFPLRYLRCHVCQMFKFNTFSNFMDHLKSRKHRRVIGYYKEKIDATLKLLRAQSRLKSQRQIIAPSQNRSRVKRCSVCDCAAKGGNGNPHAHLREHTMVYFFTRCLACSKNFSSRAELEAHKLTFPHLKAQYTYDRELKEKYDDKAEKKSDYIDYSSIPETKANHPLHKVVNQMKVDFIGTNAWDKNTIPVYDPSEPSGLNRMERIYQFVCDVCPKKMNMTSKQALEHTKTKEHYDNYLQRLKDVAKQKEEEEKEKEERKKKKEEAKKKKEEAKNGKKNEGGDIEMVDLTNEEEEEEEKEKEEDGEKEEEKEEEEEEEFQGVEEVGEDLEMEELEEGGEEEEVDEAELLQGGEEEEEGEQEEIDEGELLGEDAGEEEGNEDEEGEGNEGDEERGEYEEYGEGEEGGHEEGHEGEEEEEGGHEEGHEGEEEEGGHEGEEEGVEDEEKEGHDDEEGGEKQDEEQEGEEGGGGEHGEEEEEANEKEDEESANPDDSTSAPPDEEADAPQPRRGARARRGKAGV